MKKLNTKFLLTRLKEYLIISFAAIINALSMYSFVNPAYLIAGGFSGLSAVLTYVIDPLIPALGFDELVSYVYIVLNTPLLICSLIFLRGDFTFKTIWATIVCTIALKVFPMMNFPKFTDTHAKIIAVTFGGILIGIAMYTAAEYNGSNGGTEVLAKIVAKYHPEIDLSKVIFIANIIIMVGGSVVVMLYKGQGASIIIYSFLYILIGSKVFDVFKRGFNLPQKFLIITTEYEQMAQELTNHFKRGCSFMDCNGTRPDSPERKVVVVVVQHRQTPALKRIIRAIDPEAFTIVKDVHDVFSRPTFNRSYKTK